MVMHRNQIFKGKPPIKNQTASRTTLKLYTVTEDEVRDKKKKKSTSTNVLYFKTKNLIQILIQINSSGFGLIYINFGIYVRLEHKPIQIKTIIMMTAYPYLSPECSHKSFS